MMLAARDSILFGGGKYWGLCLKVVDPNGSTISMQKVNSPNNIYLQYSFNGTAWTAFGSSGSTVLNLNNGQRVWFKATTTNTSIGLNTSSYYKFVFSGKVAASGDITSLLNGDNPVTSLATGRNSAFLGLFRESTLVEAPYLPATYVGASAVYSYMFYGCTQLTKVATLPQSINSNSYYIGASMYYGCSSLTDVDMSGTTISTSSISGMGSQAFRNCTSLRKIKMPIVPAIGTGCFNGCSSLEVVDFRHVSSVVNLSNINAFNNTNDTYKVVVPDSLYSSWITTTNWSNASIVGHIVKASDYVEV